ncbi:MAG: hypothetical protein KAH56_13175 [Candidatus Krumholzibacteria bacterium]|nr:hypothetical protein [Candidatus Krumholzibacteria bacterium]
MINITTEFLANIEIGKPRRYENMTIHPVRYKGEAGPDYISLDTALASGGVVIKEVSEGGSVPDLAVHNKSGSAVLVLDGEELHGAKQNRVLNTTILIAAGVEMNVPVSCTEQGRWSYSSAEFSSSQHVMRHDVRSRKMSTVHASLSEGRGYSSDQMRVWEDLRCMGAESGVSSPTSAMSDTYKHHQKSIDTFVEAFPVEEDQAGLLAYIDGRLAGCDFVSRPGVYGKLHDKLLRSYAVDAVVRDPESATREDAGPEGDPAADFLAAIAQCKQQNFESVGMGEDIRFLGPDLIGTALAVEGVAVHAAFFPKPGEENHRPGAQILKRDQRIRNLWDKMTG